MAAVRRPSTDVWHSAIKHSVLLRTAPQEAHGYLWRGAKTLKTAVGEVLYSQGAVADAFYIVISGCYRATHIPGAQEGLEPHFVREYGMSEAFGSHELILGGPRTVTVTAVEAGSVLAIKADVFERKLKSAPVPPPSLVERVRRVPLFASLSKLELTTLCRAAADVQLDKGESLYRQGDIAHEFYVLEDGRMKSVKDGRDEEKTILTVEMESEQKPPLVVGIEALHNVEEERVHATDMVAWGGGCKLLRFSVADTEALLGYSLQVCSSSGGGKFELRCARLMEWICA